MFDFDLTTLLFQYRGIDSAFTAIRVATLVTFVAWPLVAFVGIMALGGKPLSRGGRFGEILSTLLYLVVIAYPLIFMLTINFAEQAVVPASYVLGLAVGLLPLASVTIGLTWLLRGRSRSAHRVRDEGENDV